MAKILEMTVEERREVKKEADRAWAEKAGKFRSEAPPKDVSRFNGVPAMYQKRWLAAYEGTISKPGAIRMKCFDCVGYEDVKETIGKCKARSCALWNYRPIKA